MVNKGRADDQRPDLCYNAAKSGVLVVTLIGRATLAPAAHRSHEAIMYRKGIGRDVYWQDCQIGLAH